MKKPLQFPLHNSQTGQALALMLQGRQISHLDFQKHTASYCLRADIFILFNKLGWPIVRTWFNSPTVNKSGRRSKFKRYWLEPETIAEIGERGKKFVKAVQDYEARAVAAARAKNQMSKSGKPTQRKL